MVTLLTGYLNAPYVEVKCSCKKTKLSFWFVFINLHINLKFFQWPTLITHFMQCILTSCKESFTVDQNRNGRQKCQLIRPVIKTFFQNVVNWLHFSLHFIEALSIDGVSVLNVKQYSFLLFYSSKPRNQVWILIYRNWSNRVQILAKEHAPKTKWTLTLSLPECLMEFCKVTLTFESMDEILWCDRSNESSLPVLSHDAICFAKF